MNFAVTSRTPTSFASILDNIDLQLEPFNINRCDERTLYIPISLQIKGDKVVCDIIYLVDKIELLGAISLNNHYDHACSFFKKHFNYNIMYRDEQQLAKIISQTPHFNHYVQKYSAKYPKYISTKSFPI